MHRRQHASRGRRSRNRRWAQRVGVLLAVGLVAATAVWALARSGVSNAQGAATTPAAAPSSGTGSTTTSTTVPAPVQWSLTTVPMRFDGVDRSYLVLQPEGIKGPLPLIVDLSGSAVSASYEEHRMDWQAVTHEAVIVFPSDTNQSWDAGNCCDLASANHVDDVGFIEAVTARVLSTVATVDHSQVYLAGYSNGGKMATDLACQDPSQWRGVAIYGATETAPCPTFPALSLQVSASTGDPELTFGPGGTPHTVNGFVEPTVAQLLATGRQAAGCPASPASTATAGALTTTTWSCADGRKVDEALFTGGSHSWPQPDGATPGETAAMWAFFVSLGA